MVERQAHACAVQYSTDTAYTSRQGVCRLMQRRAASKQALVSRDARCILAVAGQLRQLQAPPFTAAACGTSCSALV